MPYLSGVSWNIDVHKDVIKKISLQELDQDASLTHKAAKKHSMYKSHSWFIPCSCLKSSTEIKRNSICTCKKNMLWKDIPLNFQRILRCTVSLLSIPLPVQLCMPLIQFWMPETFMKHDMYIMAPQLVSTAYFSLCACTCIIPMVARQRLGKHVPATTDNTTI
jgi:hypothetical protein